ncbi:DUF3618 domain-containing protein [Parafrankia sp. EUN1f]|uniref:DUF3618 domain-containing protein n=1 Tax=Parafrankia sp. EUN1f TaxID=102897 RepID=UPI0001C46C58|nr:DUF3618 domain-containing protein [Parafrankia sp. EUN1f]EFC80612.1 hypothetical protein FrEUN1fDRAFT_6256 [Parafrankia sp. EUN1f]
MTSTKPDEIRSEIETTRAQLGQDLDVLSDRLRPHKVAGRTAQGVKTKVAGAGTAGRTKATSLAVLGRDRARENPRVAGSAAGGAAALGVLTAFVARRRHRRGHTA